VRLDIAAGARLPRSGRADHAPATAVKLELVANLETLITFELDLVAASVRILEHYLAHPIPIDGSSQSLRPASRLCFPGAERGTSLLRWRPVIQTTTWR